METYNQIKILYNEEVELVVTICEQIKDYIIKKIDNRTYMCNSFEEFLCVLELSGKISYEQSVRLEKWFENQRFVISKFHKNNDGYVYESEDKIWIFYTSNTNKEVNQFKIQFLSKLIHNIKNYKQHEESIYYAPFEHHV